jgi:hypothetical protein
VSRRSRSQCPRGAESGPSSEVNVPESLYGEGTGPESEAGVPESKWDRRPELSQRGQPHAVETMGIEPTTSGLQSPRSTN